LTSMGPMLHSPRTAVPFVITAMNCYILMFALGLRQ